MPANRVNYLVLYRGESQVYGATTKERALETPPPDGVPLSDKRVMFISLHPDDGTLVVHSLPQEEIMNAILKEKKKANE